MNDWSFVFSGRSYQARFLPGVKSGETDSVVFGLGLNLKLDKVYVIHQNQDGSWW